jgi:hypothetical protein
VFFFSLGKQGSVHTDGMHDVGDVLFCLFALVCDGGSSVALICLCLTVRPPSENLFRRFVE